MVASLGEDDGDYAVQAFAGNLRITHGPSKFP